MEHDIFLSIVIPTKDRYKFLNLTTKYLTSISWDRPIEIIVQDNSQDKAYPSCRKEFLRLAASSEIVKYCHTSELISMRENCDRACIRANGKYVCMIGDDDFILPSVIKACTFAEENAYDFILPSGVTYYWPETRTRAFGVLKYGAMVTRKLVNGATLQSEDALHDAAQFGFTKIGQMPRLYQGIVKNEVLARLRREHGTIFLAAMPDMSSSYLLACNKLKGYIYPEYLIVNGVSSGSGGGKGAAGTHHGPLESAYGLTKADIQNWPDELIRYWSGGTVWAASAMTVAKRVQHDQTGINLNGVRGYLLAHYPSVLFQKVYNPVTLVKLNIAEIVLQFSTIFVSRIRALLINRLSKFFPEWSVFGQKFHNKVTDIYRAKIILETLNEKNNSRY